MEYKGEGVSNGKSLGLAVILDDEEMSPTTTGKIIKKDEVEKVSSSILHLIKEYNSIINKGDKK